MKRGVLAIYNDSDVWGHAKRRYYQFKTTGEQFINSVWRYAHGEKRTLPYALPYALRQKRVMFFLDMLHAS
jgi:hypothetical protein